jgi:hypothetical protein
MEESSKENRTKREALQWVRLVADDLARPGEGECLACFVARMLRAFGCSTTLRFAMRYRDLVAPRATGLERQLGDLGGRCDCEIFGNAVQLAVQFAAQVWERDEDGSAPWPDELPSCQLVPPGSTQWCGNWAPVRGCGRW